MHPTRRRVVLGVFTLVSTMVLARAGSAQEAWPLKSGATSAGSLSASLLVGGNAGGIVIKPQITRTVNIRDLELKHNPAGTKLRFGPFSVSLAHFACCGGSAGAASALFQVRVFAQSSPLAEMVPVGSVSRTLTAPLGTKSSDLVFVEVDLPQIPSRIRVDGTVNFLDATASASFPSSVCGQPSAPEGSCLLAERPPMPPPTADDMWPLVPDATNAGTLKAALIVGGDAGGGNFVKPIIERHVDIRNLQQFAVFKDNRVRFGPFTASLSHFSCCVPPPPGTTVSATFEVRILARSPQQLQTLPELTEIGKFTKVLTAEIGHAESETFFVEAIIPGVYSSIRVDGKVTFLGDDAVENFPTPLCGPRENGDQHCLQSGINPLGVLFPVVPVTILYEPPGNCSFASFSSSTTAGVNISSEQANAGTRHVLYDKVLFGGLLEDEHTDTTWSNEDQKRKGSTVRLKSGVTVGTQLFPNGDARCTQVDQQKLVPDRRATAGPGKGDVFWLAVNSPQIWWNTQNLTSSRHLLPTEPLPPDAGLQPTQAIVFANDLATKENLPPALKMAGISHEDLDAILALDPFATKPPGNANAPVTSVPFVELPANRYVRLAFNVSLGANGPPIIVEQERADTRFSISTVREAVTKANQDTNKGELEMRLLNTAVQKGGEKARDAAAKALKEYLTTKVGPVLAEGIEEGIKSVSIPTFYKDEEKVTIQNTLSSAKLIENSTATNNVQSVFIKDTLRSLDLQAFYDQLFGTFAFQERPTGMGRVSDLIRSMLDDFGGKPKGQSGWFKTVALGRVAALPLPTIVQAQLSEAMQGTPFFLAALPLGDFEVHAGYTAGLPAGVTLTPEGLSGQPTSPAGVYQQPFYVLNVAGDVGGLLWQTVVVAEPNGFGSAVCERFPNPQLPGTEIVTCCSAGGICDSHVAPAGGATHIEAESFTASAGVSRVSPGIGNLDDGDWARYAAVDFGDIEGAFRTFRVGAATEAAGARIELWLDGTTASTGRKIAEVTTRSPALCGGQRLDPQQVLTAAVAADVAGVHDLFLVTRRGSYPLAGSLATIDWFELSVDDPGQDVSLRALYRNGDAGTAADSQIIPQLSISNLGDTAMPLEDVTARYWYTIDTGAPQQFTVDWTPLGNQKVTGKFTVVTAPRVGGDHYLEVGFVPGTCALPPGANTGELFLRVNKTNWSDYDETNDYSYRPVQADFSDWSHVTLYVKGKLVWGVEPAPAPGSGDAASGKKLRVQYKVGDPGAPQDGQLLPRLAIINDGTVNVPLSELKARYWFTGSGAGTYQSFVEWAALGTSKVTSRIVTVSPARPRADRYIEIGFTSSSGALGPFVNGGEIQLRANRSDWGVLNETDDHSYVQAQTTFQDAARVTLYRNGVLVWGTEP